MEKILRIKIIILINIQHYQQMHARDVAIEDVLKDLGMEDLYQPPSPVKEEGSKRTTQRGPSIRMGAQGFTETEYSPTHDDYNDQQDMPRFPELISEDGRVYSETPGRPIFGSLGEPIQVRQSLNPKQRRPLLAPGNDDMTKGLCIEQILDPNFSSTLQKYALTLKINYKTKPGESVCVVGEIQELGQWKSYEYGLMRWTENHIWVLENLLVSSKPYFNYKYVVIKENEAPKWEKGQNRIADLRILPNERQSVSALESHVSSILQSRKFDQNALHVSIYDVWEQFTITFQIYYPDSPANDHQNVIICGSIEQLGRDNHHIRMKKDKNAISWLPNKYGKDMRPYEFSVSIKSFEMEKDLKEFNYQYLLEGNNGHKINEKMPKRSIQLQSPESYRGLSNFGLINQNKMWVINGSAIKVEGNLVPNFFTITEIPETGIWFGPYAVHNNEFEMLRQCGITQIISLMTDSDLEYRQVKLESIGQLSQSNQIKYNRISLDDSKEEQYAFDLISAAKELSKFTSQNRLYLHCSSGITRAPTLLLVYLCLFKKIDCWNSSENTLKYLESLNSQIVPNMKIVNKVLEQNQAFQNKLKPRIILMSSADKGKASSDTSNKIGSNSEIHMSRKYTLDVCSTLEKADGYQLENQGSSNSEIIVQHSSLASEAHPDEKIQIRSRAISPICQNEERIEQDGNSGCNDGQALHDSQEQEEIANEKAATEEADLLKQFDTEAMLAEFQNKIRKEMEEKIRLQQEEAEIILILKEEASKLEIQKIKEQVIADKLQKQKMKEIKRQEQEQTEKFQKQKEAMEKQQLFDNLSHKMREIDQLKQLLNEQTHTRAQAEAERAQKEKELEAILEQERIQAQKDKEEAIRIEKEKHRKARDELIKFKAQQEEMNRQHQQKLEIERQLKEKENKQNQESEKQRKQRELQYRIDEENMRRNATDDECERTIIGISEFQNIEKEQKELDPQDMIQEQNPKEASIEEKISESSPSIYQQQQQEDELNFLEELSRISSLANEKRMAKLKYVEEKEKQEAEERHRQIELLAQEKLQKENEAQQAKEALERLEAQEREHALAKQKREEEIMKDAYAKARQQILLEQEEQRQEEAHAKEVASQIRIEVMRNKEKTIEELKTKLEQQKEAQLKEEQAKEEVIRQIREENHRMVMETQEALRRAAQLEKEKKRLEAQKHADEQEKQKLERENQAEIARLEKEKQELFEKQKQQESERILQHEKQKKAEKEREHLIENGALNLIINDLIKSNIESEASAIYKDHIKKRDNKLKLENLKLLYAKQREDEEKQAQIEKQQQEEQKTFEELEKEAHKEIELKSQPLMINTPYQAKLFSSSQIAGSQTPNARAGSSMLIKDSCVPRSPPMNKSIATSEQNRSKNGTPEMTKQNSSNTTPQSQINTYETYEDLFTGVPPIIFKPKKGNLLDEQISKVIKKQGVKVPIVCIKPGLYLIGCNRCPCKIQFEQVTVQLGGGRQKIEDYMQKNEAAMQHTLIDQMVKTQSTLETVVDRIVKGKNIPMIASVNLVGHNPPSPKPNSVMTKNEYQSAPKSRNSLGVFDLSPRPKEPAVSPSKQYSMLPPNILSNKLGAALQLSMERKKNQIARASPEKVQLRQERMSILNKMKNHYQQKVVSPKVSSSHSATQSLDDNARMNLVSPRFPAQQANYNKKV